MSEEIRRGPGRPRNPEAAVSSAAPEATEQQPRPQRRVRNPFGGQTQKLAYPPREGYHRHWFNDTPGRIKQAESGGYTPVMEEGKPVQRVVGPSDGGMVAFLMEIPEEWYKEDIADAQARVDEIDAAIRRGNVSQKSAQDREEHFYAGSQGRGIKIQQSR